MTVADPPVLQHYLLESPWPVAVALLIGAGALTVVGLREGRKKLLTGALLLSLLAGLLLAVATAVVTKREQLLAHTADLLAMTDPVNTTGLQRLFASELTLQNDAGQVWMDGPDILDRLERLQRDTPIGNHKVTDIKAETRRDTGYVDIRLSTSGSEASPFGNTPVLSRWLLVWKQQADGGWLLSEVRWLEFQLSTPQPGVLR